MSDDLSVKAGARHSANDKEHIRAAHGHAQAIMESMMALGMSEEDTAGKAVEEEEALPPIEVKTDEPATMEDGEPTKTADDLPIVPEMEDRAYAPIAAVKAVGDYTLKIRGIVRGGHDLVGDTFTKDTDLGFDRSPVGMPVYYDHGQRGVKSQVGRVIAWEDTGDAIDFTVELNRAKRYANNIMQLGTEKALGGSTGAVGHLVVREAGVLKRWIVGELSLTPTPAEPRTVPTDTKSVDDAPETMPETGRSPVAYRSVLPALVMAYTTTIEHDIKRRLNLLRRQP